MERPLGRKLSFGAMFGAMAWMALIAPVAVGQAAAGAHVAVATPSARPEFEVASVRPSAPLDMQKLAADMQAGKMPKMGPRVDGLLAEYTYLSLKDLLQVAYKVKAYQVTCPDWMGTQRFDISARMPEGSTKDDAPKMLQTLLEDRFHLTMHRDTQEHPVLALVVGKDGPMLKNSPTTNAAIDPDAPLQKGEIQMDTPDGPARMTTAGDGSMTMNMGAKGITRIKMDGQTIHIASDTTTMAAFADMLTQVMQMGGGGGKPVLDMTGLKGNYQVSLDISMAAMMAFAVEQAKSMGVSVPGAAGGAEGGPAGAAGPAEASDPGGGGSTVYKSVEALGLKLETRKAPIEQIVVDSAEKTPTEN